MCLYIVRLDTFRSSESLRIVIFLLLSCISIIHAYTSSGCILFVTPISWPTIFNLSSFVRPLNGLNTTLRSLFLGGVGAGGQYLFQKTGKALGGNNQAALKTRLRKVDKRFGDRNLVLSLNWKNKEEMGDGFQFDKSEHLEVR